MQTSNTHKLNLRPVVPNNRPATTIDKHIGNIIRRLRKERHITQDEVSMLTGMCQYTLSNIERGKQTPHKGTLEKLSKILGVDLLPEQERLRRKLDRKDV